MWKDLLWALRGLRARPFFTASIALILALGIGANTAIFSIVDAVLLRPLPYQNPGRLIRIQEIAAKRVVSTIPAPDYLRLSGRSDLFEKTTPFLKDNVVL